tara:strand:- start:307 stop:654 length:348 start_codon:yes stop_codon:yes gene_type:complete
MGVIISEAISTSLGATTQAYINIQEYHINKKGILTLVVRLYTSKNASINSPHIMATHRNISQKVKIVLNDGDNDPTDTDIYTFGYGKLKEYLDVHFDSIDDDWDELELEREIIEE